MQRFREISHHGLGTLEAGASGQASEGACGCAGVKRQGLLLGRQSTEPVLDLLLGGEDGLTSDGPEVSVLD